MFLLPSVYRGYVCHTTNILSHLFTDIKDENITNMNLKRLLKYCFHAAQSVQVFFSQNYVSVCVRQCVMGYIFYKRHTRNLNMSKKQQGKITNMSQSNSLFKIITWHFKFILVIYTRGIVIKLKSSNLMTSTSKILMKLILDSKKRYSEV